MDSLTVLVFNNDNTIQYSLHNPIVQQPVMIGRQEIELRIRAIAAAPFCSYSVAPSYVNDELEKNSLLMILLNGFEGIGFIMARSQVDQGYYLDVICSAEGTGSAFLKFFMAYCESQGAAYVELNSLINVLGYYPMLGFEHRMDCIPGKGANMGMSKELLEHLKAGKKDKRLQEYTDYYKDPYMMRYVIDLHKHGYTSTIKPPICTKKSLSGPRFAQYHCARDGFKMRKCFGLPAVPPNVIVPFEPIDAPKPAIGPIVEENEGANEGANEAMAVPAMPVPTKRQTRQKPKTKEIMGRAFSVMSKKPTKKRALISNRELASLRIPSMFHKSKETRRIRKSAQKM